MCKQLTELLFRNLRLLHPFPFSMTGENYVDEERIKWKNEEKNVVIFTITIFLLIILAEKFSTCLH